MAGCWLGRRLIDRGLGCESVVLVERARPQMRPLICDHLETLVCWPAAASAPPTLGAGSLLGPGGRRTPALGRGCFRLGVGFAALSVACGAAWLVGAPSAGAVPVVQSFGFTGGLQSFVIPAGVSVIAISANGGSGGSGGADAGHPVPGSGGSGASVTACVNVTAGQTLSAWWVARADAQLSRRALPAGSEAEAAAVVVAAAPQWWRPRPPRSSPLVVAGEVPARP